MKTIPQLSFSTRQDSIKALHDWYVCPAHLSIVQPFRLRENQKVGRIWTLSCGHETRSLSMHQKLDAIEGGHNQELFLTFETREADGLQSEHMTQWARSFLLNYYLHMYAFENHTQGVSQSTVAITDTGNVARNIPNATGQINSSYATQAGAGTNAYGMQIGTGSSANVAGTIQLGTLIAEGAGAGQINHGSMGITTPAGSAPESYTFTRTFSNNSAGAITINEVGLALESTDSGSAIRNILIMRDTTGGVTVNAAANTTGTYTKSYTIS